MAVRRQRATTKSEVINTDIDLVVKNGKLKYRNDTDEFFIFETHKSSGYYFSDSNKLNENYLQHWKFNYDNNRWKMQ